MTPIGTIERKSLLSVVLSDWKAKGVEVRSIRFAPGQETGVHSHPCPVIGYIAEGSAILQVEGQPEQRLEIGQAFYEPADTKILRFDNASSEQPLHFIAMYLMKGDHPLIVMLE
ncbi:MAG TPA: cupin domain-containing protein [Candidatus Angelobacter sp.]|nr:cupin domain-containing protein [Candidatus Angelobacter sp.]